MPLVVAGFVGELIGFAALLPYGLLAAIFGAIVGGALCIGLAGGWVIYHSTERQADTADAMRTASSTAAPIMSVVTAAIACTLVIFGIVLWPIVHSLVRF